MNSATAFVTRLDADTLMLVERPALARGLSDDAFAADAICPAAEDEAERAAFLQDGIGDADAGRVVSNDVMREPDGMIRRQGARWAT